MTHLRERDVEKQIDSLVAAYGYRPVATKAEASRFRAGVRAGHSDRVYVHPQRPAFFAELKAPKASTKAARKAKQAAFAETMRQRGFKAYVARDREIDQYAAFLAWFNQEIMGAKF